MSTLWLPGYSAINNLTYYCSPDDYGTESVEIVFPSNTGFWNLFFQNYVNVSETEYNANPGHYEDMFSKYYKDFYLAEYAKTGASPDISNTEAWKEFLNNSNLILPFVYLFDKLRDVLEQIQRANFYKASRLQLLNHVEHEAIKKMEERNYKELGTSSDSETIAKNRNLQVTLQGYMGLQALARNYSSATSSFIEGANNAAAQQTTIIASVGQRLKAMLRQIFR